MRALLDTNILARAARGGTSPASELVERLASLPHVLIVSPFLLSELSRVLRYERMREMHGLDEQGINAYVQRIGAASLALNVPRAPSSVVPHDPDDDPVIAAAVAAQADVICTRDRHFQHPDVQAYSSQHGIRTMTDVELLQVLRAAEKQE